MSIHVDFLLMFMMQAKASANGSIVFISGKPKPRSHLLTALSVTCSFCANSTCVMLFSFRNVAMNVPNFLASIYQAPPLRLPVHSITRMGAHDNRRIV